MRKQYDAVIIGSGLTGSLVAEHLSRQGQTVCILERGGIYTPSPTNHWSERWEQITDTNRFTNRVTDPYERTEVVNEGKDPFVYNMKFGLGGSGAVWSGASFRFTENDFRLKSQYGVGDDWPIQYQDLEPFYALAEQEIGVSGDCQAGPWRRSSPYPMPPFRQSYLDHIVQKYMGSSLKLEPIPMAVCSTPYRGRSACIGANSCVSFCPSSARYRSDETHLSQAINRKNCELIDHAVVMKLVTDGRNRIDYAIVNQRELGELKIRGNMFFLCANAVENTRLLLFSKNSRFPKGLANRNGLVGKFFMSQGGVTFYIIMPEDTYPYRGRPITSVGLDYIDGKFRENYGAFLVEVWNRVYNLGNLKKYLNRVISEGNWGNTLLTKLDRWKRSVRISTPFEILPSEKRSLTLSAEYKDAFNRPLPRVTFSFNRYERRTMANIIKLLNNSLPSSRIVKTGYGINGNHPLGTCRMGKSAESGVVDEYMRTFDHENLFIHGGACFVTSTPFNPSLTIAALTLRSLNHIAPDQPSSLKKSDKG